MNIEIGKTGRGFARADFEDFNEEKCSIQDSSLATANAIWLGVNKANPKFLVQDKGWVPYPISEEVSFTTRMHLSREQVAALIPILQRFVDTGSIEE